MIKNIIIILLFVVFVCGLFWIAIVDEIYYYKTTKYSLYTIQIELLNNSIDTIETRQPKCIHFQVNCHSRKGEFNGCDLQAIPKDGELYNFLGGHWYGVRDGVINFEILKKIDE
ncbi:hypothetical protein M0Q50_06800 [bacterium]|jgi:hypothetical protein|nr:hypothetical protein [bacterium]